LPNLQRRALKMSGRTSGRRGRPLRTKNAKGGDRRGLREVQEADARVADKA